MEDIIEHKTIEQLRMELQTCVKNLTASDMKDLLDFIQYLEETLDLKIQWMGMIHDLDYLPTSGIEFGYVYTIETDFEFNNLLYPGGTSLIWDGSKWQVLGGTYTYIYETINKLNEKVDENYDDLRDLIETADGKVIGAKIEGRTQQIVDKILILDTYSTYTIDQKFANLPSQKIPFNIATVRAQINSNDTLATIFGKIAKWYSDLGALAWVSKVDYLTQVLNAPTKLSQFQNDAYYVIDKNYVHTDNNYTTEEKQKLQSLEGSPFRGEFRSKTELEQSVTNPKPGDYAYVDRGVGQLVVKYIWDSTDRTWVLQQGVSTEETPESIKEKYESNPDTNAFTDNDKSKLDNLPANAQENVIEHIKQNGVELTIVDKTVEIETNVLSKITLQGSVTGQSSNFEEEAIIQTEIPFSEGANTVTSLTDMPVDKEKIIANISEASTISFIEEPQYGHIIKVNNITNTNIIIDIPRGDGWESLINSNKVVVPANGNIELVIVVYPTYKSISSTGLAPVDEKQTTIKVNEWIKVDNPSKGVYEYTVLDDDIVEGVAVEYWPANKQSTVQYSLAYVYPYGDAAIGSFTIYCDNLSKTDFLLNYQIEQLWS